MKAAMESDVRERAAEIFQDLGWPGPRLEQWKYTNLSAVARQPWKDDAGSRSRELDELVREASLADTAVAELIFINGRAVGSSQPGNRNAGLTIMSRAEASAAGVEVPEYGVAGLEGSALTALNVATGRDGAFIEVRDGTAADGFIHLLHVGSGDGIWSHPRNLIVAGRGAQVKVVESYVGTGSYFMNGVTEIVAGPGAVVEHYKLVREADSAFHVGRLAVAQESSSSVTSYTITVGGAIVRNEIDVRLGGTGASCNLSGLFILSGTQHADNHITVDHQKPHCESIQYFKGILDQSARGIFDSRVIVRAGAVKTVSRQTNNNLLLSGAAIVDSKPTLEILNDDVKCNHGSTIGRLDEAAMFYLRSRGLGEEEARGFLIDGFASQVVDQMKLPAAREVVRRHMFRQLPGQLPERQEKER
jgi:Fe-S cluster assembly protein SufD